MPVRFSDLLPPPRRLRGRAAAGWALPLLALLVLLSTALPAAAEPLRVALTGRYPPFSFVDADGELVGFDVDVSEEVAERTGRELVLVRTEWDGILAGLLVGRYDAIIGSMAITPERAARVDFSRPYYESGAQLFVPAAHADRISGIADLSGRPVGVGLGETYEQYLREHHPEVDLRTYKGTPDIFQDLAQGRLDGFVTDRLVGGWQAARAGADVAPAGPLLYTEEVAIPVRPGADALLADIDAAVAAMEADGTLAALEARWFGAAARAAPSEAEPVAVGAGAAAPEVAAFPTGQGVLRLLQGFAVTLLVAFASIGGGFLLAVPWGVGLHRGRGLLRTALRAANDFLRGTPVLIQLFFVYFGAPQLGLSPGPLQAAVLTLGVNAAAYMAEVVRAGLLGVPAGQREAARALGLSPWQTFRRVIWPQAFRIALPPLVNSVVALLKDTALVSVISVGEVIREAQSIIAVTYDPMRWYFLTAVLFFVVTWPLMKAADRLEQRIAARGYGG